MYKLVLLGLPLLAVVQARHPVSQEVVDEIKAKATTWEPMEVHENPLSRLTYHEIQNLLGSFPEDEYEGVTMVH